MVGRGAVSRSETCNLTANHTPFKVLRKFTALSNQSAKEIKRGRSPIPVS